MKFLKLALMFLCIWGLNSCAIQKKKCCSLEESKTSSENKIQKQQHFLTKKGAVIYKTKADYSQKVPVSLNRSGTNIAGFPSPYDLGEIRPLKLDKGYFYYANGINSKTAFLDINYDDYKQLKEKLNLDYLETLLIKEQVFTEMYFCPNIPANPTKEALNKKIHSDFKDCKKIK